MDISKPKQRKISGKMPTKRNINLATVGIVKINWGLAFLGTIVIVAIAAAISKFGVYDRIVAVTDAQAQVSNLQSKVDVAYDKVGSFGDVTEKYGHYTNSGMSMEELYRTDRIAAIKVLDVVKENGGDVGSFSIQGNVIVLPVVGSALEHINEIVQALEAHPLVNYCVVSMATTGNQGQSTGVVTGQVTIYLNSVPGQ